MSDLVVAGQVWLYPNGVSSVVIGLEAPDNDHENAIYATLIEFDRDCGLAGHVRMTCDQLRNSDATLIYDATLTSPWVV